MFKKLKNLLMVLLIIPAMFVFGACKRFEDYKARNRRADDEAD